MRAVRFIVVLLSFTTAAYVFSADAVPLSADELQTLSEQYIHEAKPNMNPSARFKATEVPVAGLWDALHVQVVGVRFVSEKAPRSDEFVLLCHDKKMTKFVETIGGPGLMSGVVVGKEFFYTYAWGSGMHRSIVARLTEVDGKLVKHEAQSFRDTDVFVKKDGDVIYVEKAKRASRAFKDFNMWENAERLGKVVVKGSEFKIETE